MPDTLLLITTSLIFCIKHQQGPSSAFQIWASLLGAEVGTTCTEYSTGTFFPLFISLFPCSTSLQQAQITPEIQPAGLLPPDHLPGLTIHRQIIWIKPLVRRRKNCKVTRLKLHFPSSTCRVGARVAAPSAKTDASEVWSHSNILAI